MTRIYSQNPDGTAVSYKRKHQKRQGGEEKEEDKKRDIKTQATKQRREMRGKEGREEKETCSNSVEGFSVGIGRHLDMLALENHVHDQFEHVLGLSLEMVWKIK